MISAVMTYCFREADLAFSRRVHELVGSTEVGRPFRAAVESMLGESYPLAVVLPRRGIATVEADEVWYDFRDGAIAPHEGGSK